MFYYKDKRGLNIYKTVKLLFQESDLKEVSAALEYWHYLVQNKENLTKRSERYFLLFFPVTLMTIARGTELSLLLT